MLEVGFLVFLAVSTTALCAILGRRAAYHEPMTLAFAELDELDEREAEDAEYVRPMAVLSWPLPAWAAEKAAERLADDGRPRRRYVELLRRADVSTVRPRLVAMAADASDPMAPEVWSLLTARPAGEWARAFVASDGGADEAAFLAKAPVERSRFWLDRRFGPGFMESRVQWRGYYRYETTPERHEMRLFGVWFDDYTLHGWGDDDVGAFAIAGTCRDGSVEFTKQYGAMGLGVLLSGVLETDLGSAFERLLGSCPTHAVEYRGWTDGRAIDGTWRIPENTAGDFRLWREIPGSGDRPIC
jgi:hypothetical protein